MEHPENKDTIANVDGNTDTTNIDNVLGEETTPEEPTPTESKAKTSPKWTKLGVRTVSGIVLATLVLAALCSGGFVFLLIILLAALQMLREWDRLTEKGGSIWGVAGLFYVAIPCAAILWIRNIQIDGYTDAGFWLVLYVLFVVWATDIGAYFTGRTIGGAKLAPTISPGKTWAGLGGGIGAAGVVGGLSCLFTPYPATLFGAISIAVLLAIVSQSGDLFESWIKRRAGKKDSGTLIPGHGGLLDRVDGLMFAIPLFAFMLYLSIIIK